MKKQILIFSDGSIDFQFSFNSANKKIKILKLDYKNFILNKKRKTNNTNISYQFSKYKNRYLF